jgi:hypothetical protein
MDCGCRELELGEREEELEALSDKVKVRPHIFSIFSQIFISRISLSDDVLVVL